jgi:hypothetical protein
MKNLFTTLSLLLIYSLSIGQEVTEFNNTSELNLDPNEYNIIYGEIIIMGDNVVLEPGDQVEMVATQSITLEPGFHAKNGSNFIARIDTAANSISETNNSILQIKVFPNPTESYFTVKFHNLKDSDNYLLFLTDVNGKVIYKTTAKQELIKINLNQYAEGIYFLKTIDRNSKDVYVNKILKGK